MENKQKENLRLYRKPHSALTLEHVLISGKARLGVDLAGYSNGKVDWFNKLTIHCDLEMLIQMNAILQNNTGTVSFEYCGEDRNKLFKFGFSGDNFYIGLYQFSLNEKCKRYLKLESETSKMDIIMIKHFCLVALMNCYNSMMLTALNTLEIIELFKRDFDLLQPS